MQTLRPFLILGLAISIILAACSPATPISTTEPISPTSLPQSTTPITTPVLTTAEPVNAGIPVIETSSDGLNRLLVISPVTGKVLDTFPPIPLGHNYGYSFAPDGHTMALVSDGQLYFIDLPSWKYRTFDTGIHGWLSAVVYSPDGMLLALASGDPDAALSIVDTKSGEIKSQHAGRFRGEERQVYRGWQISNDFWSSTCKHRNCRQYWS